MTDDTNTPKKSIAPLLAPRGSGYGSAPNGSNSSMGGGEGMDRKIQKKFWNSSRIAMVVGGIAFLILIAWGLSTTAGGRKLNVDRERVTISQVEYAPFQEMISATGNVQPRTTVYIDAESGGRIEEIYVQEGAIVEEGEPILRLANASLQMQLFSSETQRLEQLNRLEQIRFSVEQNNLRLRQDMTNMDYRIRTLRRDVDRNEDLYERNAISEQEYQRTKDEYDYWVRNRALTIESYRADSLRQTTQISQMEDAIDRMEQNYALVQERLENLTVRAPVSGQLSQLNAELGEQKSAGFRFGQIDVLGDFKVEAGIDEYHIRKVVQGQRAITTPMPNEYEMVVRRVYPEVTGGQFTIDLDFVETPPDIRRGQTIRFKLEMSEPADAIIVPLGGFYQTTGGNWIYVVDPSGDFAVKRSIRLGRKNLNYYEVLDGLQEGEQVVTSSYDTFNEADRLVFK
jgi:HlyD family secretion protein